MVTVPLELNTNVSCQADNFFSQFNIVLFVYPNVRTVAFNPMPSILAFNTLTIFEGFRQNTESGKARKVSRKPPAPLYLGTNIALENVMVTGQAGQKLNG